MLDSIRNKFKDIRIISQLCTAAEKWAQAEGQSQPGAEHFLLATFDLPDGSARRVFERLQKNPDELPLAIHQQYADALQNLGIDGSQLPSAKSSAPASSGYRLYKAQPSGQAVMQALAKLRQGPQSRPLQGSDMLLVISQMQHGVAARALRKMGIDLTQLAQEAQQENQNR